jgi:hypothetical protein
MKIEIAGPDCQFGNEVFNPISISDKDKMNELT